MWVLSLELIYANESENPNALELLSLQLPSLAHLDDPTIPIALPIVETTLDRNINVSSVVILPISNGTVPFTPVEHAIKLPLDTHLGHVVDEYTMTEFVDTTI
jgi:hypothetical protein